MDIIPRPLYLDRIVGHLNCGMMIFLVGQRRVGKSFLLRELARWLAKNRDNAHILHIDKELPKFASIKDGMGLYNYVCERLEENCENYLLIDEVQEIAEYENALRALHKEQRCQIVATGSNAYVFSSELATRLAGRYVEIKIYSLSYLEFLTFHKLENTAESLLLYLTYGGLPGLSNYKLDDPGKIRDYLKGVYNTIVMRDIVVRENIRNIRFLENLIKFISDNVGQLFSVNSIAKYLKSQGDAMSGEVIGNYVGYLVKSLLVDITARYDIRGKKNFEWLEKYYFSDLGLRNLLTGFTIRDSIEKLLENAVRNHLLVCGFDVAVGILGTKEIDFVATRDVEKIYIQVAYLLPTNETIDREFGNLAAIADNYPKYVVTLDYLTGPIERYPGIKYINAREFFSNFL